MSESKIKLGRLHQELREHRSAVLRLEGEIERATRKRTKEEIASAIEDARLEWLKEPIGLNRLLLRGALCFEKNAESIGLSATPIAIRGSVPWDQDEFTAFLEDMQFQVVELSENAQILVLGGRDVEATELDPFIEEAFQNERQLKVYSQELFVYWLITGEDPLEVWEDQSLIDAVAGHAPIEKLIGDEKFQWPNVPSSSNSDSQTIVEIDASDWSDESILRRLGYTAKEGELATEERRAILNRLITGDLSANLSGSEEGKRWGRPKSGQRIYATASFLAWLIGFQGSSKPRADAKWRADLDWLKRQFFRRQLGFRWPNLGEAVGEIEDRSDAPPQRQRLEQRKPSYDATKHPIANEASPSRVHPKGLVRCSRASLRQGDAVFHKNFGWGTFMSLSKDGTSYIGKVQFGQSLRKFDMSVAKLYRKH